MNGAQWVVHALRAQGVNTVFGYPGGAIMPVYDALYDGGVEHLLCRHEQGAAMAAIGYARATGKTGVCIATSGPGATNLITGLADGLTLGGTIAHSWNKLNGWSKAGSIPGYFYVKVSVSARCDGMNLYFLWRVFRRK